MHLFISPGAHASPQPRTGIIGMCVSDTRSQALVPGQQATRPPGPPLTPGVISSSATHRQRTRVCFPTGSNMSPFNRKTQLTAKVQQAWQATANPQLRHKEHDSSAERTLGTQSH